MRKFCLMVFAILLCANTLSAQMRSKVDERMELQGIVFRLAGADEHVTDDLGIDYPESLENRYRRKEYLETIDKYFKRYREHPVVHFVRNLRERKDIGGSQIPSSSLLLEIRDGGICSSMDDSPSVWGDDWKKYVSLLDDFYRKSNFNRFFKAQSDIYEEATKGIDAYLERINTSWFSDVFGSFDVPEIYLCGTSGMNVYSFPDQDAEGGYSISVGYNPLMSPTYDKILQEIMHHYSSVTEDYYPQVEDAMTRIFENPDLVARYRFSGNSSKQDVFNGWITNMLTIMYGSATDTLGGGAQRVSNSISVAVGIDGYVWMRRAMEFMDYFYSDRETYPVFADFMPRLCEFLRFTTRMDTWEKVMDECRRSSPYVVSVYPVNGSNLADYSTLDEIRICFSEPMLNTFGYKEIFPEGEDRFFDMRKAYWEDSMTYVIPVIKENLDKSESFKLTLYNRFLVSSKYMTKLDNDYEIEYYFFH